jgi:hypothetical protein
MELFFSTKEVGFSSIGENLIITATKTETDEIFTLKVNNFNTGNFSFEGLENVASYENKKPISGGIWTTNNATNSRGNISFTEINFSKKHYKWYF